MTDGAAALKNRYKQFALADVDWQSRDGHYRVRIDDEWWDVPDGAVVDQPNRDGRTLVCTYNDWNELTGKLTIRVRSLHAGDDDVRALSSMKDIDGPPNLRPLSAVLVMTSKR